MAQPVVHFEIIGQDPIRLRRFYGDLFDWTYEGVDEPADDVVGDYGFVPATLASTGVGIPGGVGGGPGFEGRVLVYVAVPDVEAALRSAEALGGTRVLGPYSAPGSDLVVGHLTDPEGQLVGVASAT